MRNGESFGVDERMRAITLVHIETQVLARPISEVGGVAANSKSSQCLFLSSSDRYLWTAHVHDHPDKDKIRGRERNVRVGEWQPKLWIMRHLFKRFKAQEIELSWRCSLFIGKLVSGRKSLADRGWRAFRRTRFGLKTPLPSS